MSALPDPARPLTEAAAGAAFDAVLAGFVPEQALADFLLALARRGETAEEIAGAARALRARMRPVSAPAGAVDVCGTGGDGAGTLNVSTAVAFVVAGAGVPVAKHGNRAASSRCGTADVLEALGWPADQEPARAEACLHEVGVAFLFAQAHHPAMARVAPVRRALGVRTIFNLLGPLANPAGVRRQLIGVAAPGLGRAMAEAALRLGAEAVLIAHGDGLDELAVHAPSRLWEAGMAGRSSEIEEALFDPAARGLGPHPRDAVAGGSPAENAEALRALLSGRGRPAYRDIVLANAAAALRVAGLATDWEQGLRLASESLASGAARDRLERFLAFR